MRILRVVSLLFLAAGCNEMATYVDAKKDSTVCTNGATTYPECADCKAGYSLENGNCVLDSIACTTAICDTPSNQPSGDESQTTPAQLLLGGF
jgi:hypothetical protein